MSIFKPATRERVFLKLGITGGPGDGKTTSALRLATGLANGGKICVLDTENSSVSLYAESFRFDTLNLSAPFTDDKFVTGIKAAEAERYSVAIIDSFSHSWIQTLEDKTTLDARGGNSYTNWGVAGRKFKNVMDAVLQSHLHVICCLRSKMSYVLETDIRGKQVPKKVGLEPVTREGTEYEFAVLYDCGSNHYCTVSKDRTNLFINRHFQITEDTGRQLLDWLISAPPPEPEPTVQERLSAALTDIDPQLLSAYLTARGAAPDGLVASVSDGYATKALGIVTK
jgi:hypothetical protein